MTKFLGKTVSNITLNSRSIIYLPDYHKHSCTGKGDYELVIADIDDSRKHKRYRNTLVRCKTCNKVFWLDDPEKKYTEFEEAKKTRTQKKKKKKTAGNVQQSAEVRWLPKGMSIYCMYKKYHPCTGEPEYIRINAHLFYGKMDCKMYYCKTCRKFIYEGVKGALLDLNNAEGWYYDLYSKSGRIESSVKREEVLHEETIGNTVIRPKDFLVVTSAKGCSVYGHNLSDIDARIRVLAKSGKIIELIVPAIFCRSCKRHYLLEQDYTSILHYGTPLCKVISLDSYIRLRDGTLKYSEESLLHSLGYNVNAQEGLSAKERQRILGVIIDEGVMEKHEIFSFLSYLIRRSSYNARLETAVEKWSADRVFVSQYERKPAQIVDIQTITVRRHLSH